MRVRVYVFVHKIVRATASLGCKSYFSWTIYGTCGASNARELILLSAKIIFNFYRFRVYGLKIVQNMRTRECFIVPSIMCSVIYLQGIFFDSRIKNVK